MFFQEKLQKMSFLFNVDQNTLSRQSRPSFERYPRIELDLNRMSSGNNTYSIALNLSGAIIFILTIVSQFSCTVLFLDLYFDIQYQCLSVLCELFYRAPGGWIGKLICHLIISETPVLTLNVV